MRHVYVVGVGMTKWGVYPDKEWYDLGSEAMLNALDDAQLEWKDIQAVFAGSVYQGTGSGHQAVKEIGLTGIPIVNVENACSSGSSAFRLAYQAVATGMYDVVMALGMEKMPKGPIPSTAFRPLELEMGFNVQFANYALASVKYMKEYGATEEDFARVTVKNRRNGALNPYARFQQPVTIEEVMNSRMVAKPLRLFHCCPLADGAAAAILCSENKVKAKKRAVSVAASVLASGVYGEEMYMCGMVESVKYPPKEGIIEISAKEAYETAGLGPEDIDVIQAYDTMAPSELWDLEKLGFCAPGEAPRLLREGVFDINGKLPVNTDGGLMSRGHPLGATALGQIFELVCQLRGESGQRQVKGAKTGLAHAMGAGPNSSVTILVK
ncbi:MAG TPA: thiolase family protein [Deltaproteobacteria bacterium]|nr:thiolase family protein [Deltaproteobacteria bacterium]